MDSRILVPSAFKDRTPPGTIPDKSLSFFAALKSRKIRVTAILGKSKDERSFYGLLSFIF